LFVGTTAERVVRFTDRPVLIVKEAGHGRYGRVLVAFDGSEAAVRALETALAICPDAQFVITHAWRPPRAGLGLERVEQRGIRNENEHIKAQIEQAVRKSVTSSGSRPVRLATNMIEDNPYVVISNESRGTELLVMGTHSKGALATCSGIGSLARHMLAEASCDVLVSPS
jgi:nucleotide-binding universal stress UspA family protein